MVNTFNAMETPRIQNKFKLLFEKISQPGYVMDNYYADGFINKLSNDADPDAVYLTMMTNFADVIMEAFTGVENYHMTVKVFLTRMLAVACRKELQFAKILCKSKDKFTAFLNEIDSPGMNHSLRVAYMEVALAVVSHMTGTYWILETGLWKKVISFKTNTVTIFVVRLMYKFSSDFLWQLNDLGDETHLKEVIDFIWKPIEDQDLLNTETVIMDASREDEICSIMEPVLQMTLSVLEQSERFYKPNIILNIFLKEFSMVNKLYLLFDKMRRDFILLKIAKLLCLFVILRVFQAKPRTPEVVYTTEDFIDMKVLYYNCVQNLLQRHNIIIVLDYSYMIFLIWSSVLRDLNIDLEHNGKKVLLKYEILFLNLTPLLVYINYETKQGKSIEDETINEYLGTLLNLACEHTARTAYRIRDLMVEENTLPLITHSVKKLTCLRGHLNDDQANFVFQALYFVLKSYSPTCVYEGSQVVENLENCEQKVVVMTYIMDTILSLVKNHNITWHETLEVLCLNTVVHDILSKRTNLTCKFVVAAINVMTVTVRKFLPPNLSLLMEARPGSAMHEIGKLIYLKMHDMNWEVRDSALELLQVCTEIAYIKFPPIKKQIMENKLINVAVTIAFNDYEPYVQASALRCVGAAIRVCAMWELVHADHPNVLEDLVLVLRNSQEGIVRKEVCNVLYEIYQNVKFTPSFKQVLYDHMASTAMCDFHWEVQMVALKFWKIVIQTLLTDHGMLDGKFPQMTFSKESRKIIHLNNTEIQKILLKVLDELAGIGCLTVLLKLIHDDNEVEVMEAALDIAQDLFVILQEYKVPEIIKPSDDEPKTVADLICDMKEEEYNDNDEEMEAETANRAENVIEGILNADDINLLSEMYMKQMSLQNEKPTSFATPKIKLLKSATPFMFVNLMNNNNCKTVIQQKREWNEGIRSVSSLLDDVLGIYEMNDDVNSLDCY